MSNTPYKGACLCGGVRFEADRISPKVAHCHCTMCRKFHGAVFPTFGEAPRTAFQWLKGEELLTTYTAHNGTKRKFFSLCGSSLIFESAHKPESLDLGSVEFSLATLDNPPTLKPDAHIYTNSKVGWLDINTRELKIYAKSRS